MTDEQILKLGIIGLDTSHVVAFSRILNDQTNENSVPGAVVSLAYPGGSSDMEKSISRVDGFTREVRDAYGVEIVDSIEQVADESDVILIESVDGRVHLDQFLRVASARKPVFIDKPFAVSVSDAERILEVAKVNAVPFLSCSALRYSDNFTSALEDNSLGAIIGIDCAGPLEIDATLPGLYWYGVHTVEMVYAALGQGCVRVNSLLAHDHETVCAEWADGRIATIRGNRIGNTVFTAVIHRENGPQFVNASESRRPFYASLLERIIAMGRTRVAPIDPLETLELTRFIACANESRSRDGHSVGIRMQPSSISEK